MKYSDNQGKRLSWHSMRQEEIAFFSFLCDYSIFIHEEKERPTF